MKKFVTFAIMFAAVAIAGTALKGAASDETPASSEVSATSAKPCCQAKAADKAQIVAAATKPKCCDQSDAKATVLTKIDTSIGDACKPDQKTAGCPLCRKDAVAPADGEIVSTTAVAKSKACSQGQCSDPAAGTQCSVAAAATQCSESSANKCGGKCQLGKATALASATDMTKAKECPSKNCNGDCAKCAAKQAVVQTVTASTKKCEFCTEESCKKECSSCAEAGKDSAASDNDAAASDNDAAVTVGPSKGMGHGQGMGHGHAGDSQHAKDHRDFFFLIEHRDSIQRTIKNLPNGIESLTESDNADAAEMIQVHVEAMYDRVENANPIRMRDPIFRAVFANADKIKMEVEHTEHGVRVTETSTDPYVVKLIQEHAKVVSLWIKNGYSELPKNHAAPKR